VRCAEAAAFAYAVFSFDHTTRVGLLEPRRVEDEYQRRGC
jgi:hypothetical protein